MSRFQSASLKVLCGIALTVCCAFIAASFSGLGREPESSKATSGPQQGGTLLPGHVFHGRTVGPDGEPLAGVVVEAVAAEMGENTLYPGSWGPVRSTQQNLTAVSDKRGHFQFRVPQGYQDLEIKAVKLHGHDWVTDRVWGLARKSPNLDNTHFLLRGGPKIPGSYVPEQDYPAVYPLHPHGDERPAAWPSRGGREVKDGGGFWFHERMPPLLPSAGGNADPSAVGQIVADVYSAWRRLIHERGVSSEAWSRREDAKKYNEQLVEVSLEIVERRKRGEIPSQLDEFRKP